MRKLIKKLKERLTRKSFNEGYALGYKRSREDAYLRELILQSMIEEDSLEIKEARVDNIH